MFCPLGFAVHIQSFRKNDEAKLKLAFAFFEDMANNESNDVQEILEFTVLETIVDETDGTYEKCVPYMGPATKEFVCQISAYLGFKPA